MPSGKSQALWTGPSGNGFEDGWECHATIQKAAERLKVADNTVSQQLKKYCSTTGILLDYHGFDILNPEMYYQSDFSGDYEAMRTGLLKNKDEYEATRIDLAKIKLMKPAAGIA